MEKITKLEDFLKGIQEKRKYPKGLQLDLSNSCIDVEEVKLIAIALQSGYCPSGMQLDLSFTQIGDEGVKVLAIALQSGRCPYGLRLSLEYSLMSDEGAKAMAIALQSGYCPHGLQLDFQINLIRAEGAKAIINALQSGNCPQDLQLNLKNNEIGGKNIEKLLDAWVFYHADQQEKFLKCLALQQSQGQINSPLSLFPQDILDEIYCYILPATPILAKMTEISAKVFCQRYISINFFGKSPQTYELVQALVTALSAKTLTARTTNIKTVIDNFLQNELKPLELDNLEQFLTVAVLKKYHLITSNRVPLVTRPNQVDEPDDKLLRKKMKL